MALGASSFGQFLPLLIDSCLQSFRLLAILTWPGTLPSLLLILFGLAKESQMEIQFINFFFWRQPVRHSNIKQSRLTCVFTLYRSYKLTINHNNDKIQLLLITQITSSQQILHLFCPNLILPVFTDLHTLHKLCSRTCFVVASLSSSVFTIGQSGVAICICCMSMCKCVHACMLLLLRFFLYAKPAANHHHKYYH